jgi:hypothetical protein
MKPGFISDNLRLSPNPLASVARSGSVLEWVPLLISLIRGGPAAGLAEVRAGMREQDYEQD